MAQSPRHHGPACFAGFTLIELLVVISIIAVLASMLMPAIRMIRESALTSVCLNNSRQILIASLQWSQDNDGMVVPSIVDNEPSNIARYWPGQLRRLMQDDDPAGGSGGMGVFRCPKATTKVWYDFNPGTYGKPSWTGISNDAVWNAGYFPIHQSQVRHGSESFFLSDSIDQGPFGSGPGNAREVNPWIVGHTWGVDFRHRDRAVVAMFDGHAESATRDRLLKDAADPTADQFYHDRLWNCLLP